jgi:hypothetical protein
LDDLGIKVEEDEEMGMERRLIEAPLSKEEEEDDGSTGSDESVGTQLAAKMKQLSL